MKDLPAELLYLIVFAVIVLFQLLTRRLAQPRRQEPEPDVEEAEEHFEEVSTPQAPVNEIREPVPAPTPSVGHFGRTEAPSVPPARALRRFSRRSLLGDKRDVQNAIVIAAIVGPCRAFEPHDPR
ncbi:MAG: hypothetical protein A3G25_05435 [Betaproteobacteria bacterium RIFCSPLOWO2_12_FULL_63_13]|nr:MAG: hypothetical protein A3H32_16335 [Betaproteobacteria bacterium RIFCSPLOWO2_02_FULL_63_19]OGA53226.1 MAG: hypothetical protein A3G25_05435 [Betaproteobacteria bacterium RIFCSPLOWO2_12_FULL_63_13]